MEATLKIENYKAKLPDDFKYLDSVFVNDRLQQGDTFYYQQNGKIYFSTEIGNAAYCKIKYLPYNIEKQTKALAWLKATFIGFPEYYYLVAIRRCNADEWFENYELSGSTDYLGNNRTYHKLFEESAEYYFEIKRVHLRHHKKQKQN